MRELGNGERLRGMINSMVVAMITNREPRCSRERIEYLFGAPAKAG